MNDKKHLITRGQLSDILKCTERTIDRYAQSNPEFPKKIRINKGRILFDMAEVNEYLEICKGGKL